MRREKRQPSPHQMQSNRKETMKKHKKRDSAQRKKQREKKRKNNNTEVQVQSEFRKELPRLSQFVIIETNEISE